MNRIKYIRQLTCIFEQYDNFVVHPECINEIFDFTSQSGLEKLFLNKLREYLNRLEDSGTTGFEKVNGKDCSNLYSMKFKGKQNLRLLFSVNADGTFLLHTFYEKVGSNADEYEPHIPIANARLKEMTSKGGF